MVGTQGGTKALVALLNDDPEPFAVRLRRRNSATAERPSVTPLALEKLAIEHFRGTEVIARVGDEYVGLLG